MSSDGRAYIGPDWYFDYNESTDNLDLVDESGSQEFTFKTDGVVSGGSGVDFKFDTSASTAAFVDSDTGDDILVANKDGNVEIPNGSLSVSSGVDIPQDEFLSFGGENYLRATSGGLYAYTRGNHIDFWDSTNSQRILQVKEGGNVEIPNGELEISSGDLRIDSTWSGVKNHSGDRVITFIGNRQRLDTQGYPWKVSDSTNEQDIAVFNEGGNVEIPNGLLHLSNGGSGGGILFDNESRIRSYPADTQIRTTGEGNHKFSVYDAANSQFVFKASEGGDVEIPNGELSVQGEGVHSHVTSSSNPHGVDSSNWNDYEIQKNGSDGSGVINFKTA